MSDYKDSTQLLSPKLPHIFYGGDYNPEQWAEETWLEDARLMQEAGVNIVSLGIFSWTKLEPQPGHYDWGWLDRVLTILDQHGIKVNLATATASPPAWLARLYPQSLPVTREGTTLWPGSRQHYCPSSPAYREAIARLVEQLATRYRNHATLAMWHINNEYACHISECYCEVSAAAFRQWLRQKYESIETLNQAWGTAFWSQHYAEWEEINPPRQAPTYANPTQQLDWKRFSSTALLECFELEARILRELTPQIPLTTNFMGFLKPLDYWKWAKSQDVISHDCYPDPANPATLISAATSYDLMRSLGNGKSWLLMEQVTSQVNWRPQNVLKRPGQMRLWSYQALARGANGTMFFQWRASQAGAEKFHGALVPHVGTENSRIWREVKQLGQELSKLDGILETTVKAKVAIIFDWESWWALELDSKPSDQVRMLNQLDSYYESLYRNNIAVDFIKPGDNLSPYQVVLVPNLYLVREGDKLGQKLEEFVASGGQLVVSFFSGIVDQNEHILLGGYPAPFRKVLGLWVEEFAPLLAGEIGQLEGADKSNSYQSKIWSEIIHLEGAETLLTFGSGFASGKPAITHYSFGRGHSYYLGTQPDSRFMDELLIKICNQAGITSVAGPAGVEVVNRQNEQVRYQFVLNHNADPVQLNFPDSTRCDLLTDRLIGGHFELEPFGVLILEEKIE